MARAKLRRLYFTTPDETFAPLSEWKRDDHGSDNWFVEYFVEDDGINTETAAEQMLAFWKDRVRLEKAANSNHA